MRLERGSVLERLLCKHLVMGRQIVSTFAMRSAQPTQQIYGMLILGLQSSWCVHVAIMLCHAQGLNVCVRGLGGGV